MDPGGDLPEAHASKLAGLRCHTDAAVLPFSQIYRPGSVWGAPGSQASLAHREPLVPCDHTEARWRWPMVGLPKRGGWKMVGWYQSRSQCDAEYKVVWGLAVEVQV